MAQWLPWRRKQSEPSSASESEPTKTEAATEEVVSALESPLAIEETPKDTLPVVPSEEKPGSNLQRPPRQSLWRRGLARLRRVLLGPIDRLFRGRPFSEELLAELEEVLITADIGVQTATTVVERLRARCRRERPDTAEVLKTYLKEELLALLQKLPSPPISSGSAKPWVILMVGVNGVGKTTTIAKLTARFLQQKQKVLLVAADTFRAAAIEQLEIWAKRLGVDCIKHTSGASPAAVAFDGVRAAIARRMDIVIIDTAGRLHTKTPLMEELKKVHRVVAKELPGAPHEVLLVLDASTGQNALTQVRAFQQALPLTGVILAKMDGSARGGVAFAVVDQLAIPIRGLGLGERAEDLQDFSATEFVEAIFAPGESEISLDTGARDS